MEVLEWCTTSNRKLAAARRLEGTRNRFSLESLQQESGPTDILILTQWNSVRLLASRTVKECFCSKTNKFAVNCYSSYRKLIHTLKKQKKLDIKVLRIWNSMHQFSSVAQSCPTLCDPMNCSTPGLPIHHDLPEFTQTHVHRVGDAIQLSHPLSSPFPPAPNPSQHQSLFQWVNSSHEVAKVFEFQL